MSWKEHLKGFNLFYKAIKSTKSESLASIEVLVVLTFIFSIILYFVEHWAQPENFSFWSSLVWPYMSYLGNPGKFSPGEPVTYVGRLLCILIAILKILIFAVPTSIITIGFRTELAKDKRNKELADFHETLEWSENLTESRSLKLYIKEHCPDDENAWYHGCKFKYIANNQRISKFELKGLDLKDILDVCKNYPEFRVKNRASALSSEVESKQDTYLLEYFPVNRVYGCCINRGSKVTIISTSSRSELDTGNFSFYLAKWAGFNYISKDFDANQKYGESYYNNPWNEEPKVDGKTLAEREKNGQKVDKDMRSLYQQKREQRELFLHDLEAMTKGEDAWAICILTQIQNQQNPVHIHVAHNTEDGKNDTVKDHETFAKILEQMTSTLHEHFDLAVEETTRFPLLNGGKGKLRNLAYKLQEDGCKCNSFTLRVSSHLMEFDSRMRPAEFAIAKAIKDAIEIDRPLPEDDVKDMNRTGKGFMPKKEQNIGSVKKLMNPKGVHKVWKKVFGQK